jgi:hypothetical protein
MRNSIYSTVNIFWMANGWFEAGGFDIKYAPVHVAFVAYVSGERFLRDVNPEVRRPTAARLRISTTSSRRRAACRWGAGCQAEANAEANGVDQTIGSVEPYKCANSRTRLWLSLESNSCYR